MTTHADKTKENKSPSAVHKDSQKQSGRRSALQFTDNRPEATAQRELQEIADTSQRTEQTAQLKEIAERYSATTMQRRESAEDEELLQGRFESIQKQGLEEEELLQGKFEALQKQGPEEEELLQGKFEAIQKQGPEEEELLQGKFEAIQKQEPEEEELLQGKFEAIQKQGSEEEELLQGKFDPIRKMENSTGLPDTLKSGVEQLSGMDISNVRVHYNSDKPAQLHAHAYAQGGDIHVAPGQEKHLPHEAWHVVQQKQSRVKPTTQVKGKANVNDDSVLEKEADVMGRKALAVGQEMIVQKSARVGRQNGVAVREPARLLQQRSKVVQRTILLDGKKEDLGSLLKQAKDSAERVILANWGWSATEHDFKKSKKQSAREKLTEAIKSAKSQVIDVPDLYSAANLKFLTKAADRLPTLYFKSGNESGRIRQQHGSGPKVVSQTNKTDYFFADEDGLSRFDAAARSAKKRKAVFNPSLSSYNATLDPTADYFHYEVTYKSGRKIAKLHRSGGKIDPDTSGYDDTRLKSIYQGVIGYST